MALFDLWLCGAARFMEESELLEESNEMKCQGDGIISGCGRRGKNCKHNEEDEEDEKESA